MLHRPVEVTRGKRTFNHEHPGYARHLIINLPLIPSLPCLVRQILVNQAGPQCRFRRAWPHCDGSLGFRSVEKFGGLYKYASGE